MIHPKSDLQTPEKMQNEAIKPPVAARQDTDERTWTIHERVRTVNICIWSSYGPQFGVWWREGVTPKRHDCCDARHVPCRQINKCVQSQYEGDGQ